MGGPERLCRGTENVTRTLNVERKERPRISACSACSAFKRLYSSDVPRISRLPELNAYAPGATNLTRRV